MTRLVKLETLFEHSAGRLLSGDQLQADPALAAEGWERRFTADEPRAKEAMELYAQLGYEVRAEPVRPLELHDDCQDCRSAVSLHYRTIYTRKRTI